MKPAPPLSISAFRQRIPILLSPLDLLHFSESARSTCVYPSSILPSNRIERPPSSVSRDHCMGGDLTGALLVLPPPVLGCCHQRDVYWRRILDRLHRPNFGTPWSVVIITMLEVLWQTMGVELCNDSYIRVLQALLRAKLSACLVCVLSGKLFCVRATPPLSYLEALQRCSGVQKLSLVGFMSCNKP
eukprot:2887340-Rhodomonas_salina.1